jgi:hypothetical protein
MVHPRWRPAGAARVPRTVAQLESREGAVVEGDVPVEAAGLGQTGRRRREGVGDWQELGRPAAVVRRVESGERERGDRRTLWLGGCWYHVAA